MIHGAFPWREFHLSEILSKERLHGSWNISPPSSCGSTLEMISML